MEIGDTVVYVDEVGQAHNALITANFMGAAAPDPSLNLVFVSDKDSEVDQYGRQIKRETSVVAEKNQAAHGRFWKEP
jgi:hypothetical protein